MTKSIGERSVFARNPLDVIAHAHALQAQLCDALERIADGLPDDVDRRLCVQIAATLTYDLPLHHHDEETALFPLLRQRASREDQIDDILDHLTSEHSVDTDFAGEIAEALELMGRGEPVPNPEMMGYMLRGFFEGYRRHIHWENTLVMPVARQKLTENDLLELAEAMERHRAQTL
ncbi:MAG: hemerythrin domain-containing protein [Alphaproteobacteria bacterium]|nr:hemerythrin domain-containing protein [Alphaproteobacteria bacterium]